MTTTTWTISVRRQHATASEHNPWLEVGTVSGVSLEAALERAVSEHGKPGIEVAVGAYTADQPYGAWWDMYVPQVSWPTTK